MKRQLHAEWYKLVHSQIISIVALISIGIVLLSFHFGQIYFFAAGSGNKIYIGFQAKAYSSMHAPNFDEVAMSALAYTAFFWCLVVIVTAYFFMDEYHTGTIKLAVAGGIRKWKIYLSKAIILSGATFLFYYIFIFIFLIIELIQTGYQFNANDLTVMLKLIFLNNVALVSLQFLTIFLCVLLKNIGVVVGLCFMYVYAGLEVYLGCWNHMDEISSGLKLFLYCNPMYYWLNYCSHRVGAAIGDMWIYMVLSIALLCMGGIIINKRELK